ncbi:MAG TPA: type III secretion inner membrane ring lipoprotein SctJ [Rhabdochlamydiaceae bacterium]|jgi:type III secretion protein J|nr:type III secretion inner membrane ring lipoprotein SctJ [Rhabdochlamydiaceae bacterium]
MRKALLWLLPLIFLISGCETSRVIVNNVDEREANEIIVFLASKGINVQKVAAPTAVGVAAQNNTPKFSLSVSEKDMNEAMAILNQNGLPRKQGTNLLELFAKQGLMTTDKEESIRYQAGLEQQIANTIRKIDGVIDAEVQLAFPESSAAATTGATPQTPTQRVTAAVYVKHQGIVDDPNSHLVSKIKRLVAGSVNGLDINDVTVISDRSRFTDVTLSGTLEGANTMPRDYTSVWSIVIAKHSVPKFRLLFFLLIASNIAFLVMAFWMVWKVYPILREHGGLRQLLNPVPMQKPEEPPKEE